MEARVKGDNRANSATGDDDSKEARVRDLRERERERERIFLKLTRVEVEVCFLFLTKVEGLTV